MSDQQKKILFSDDDALLRSVYASKFTEEGFHVTQANDGQEALDIMLGGFIPDLLITGIMMPRMTGFDLIRRTRLEPPLKNIPVIIFSHRGLESDHKEALELQVKDFVVQSRVTPNEVVRRVRLILGLATTFRISISRTDGEANALLVLLARQLNTQIPEQENIVLDVTADPTGKIFSIIFSKESDHVS